MTRKEYAAVRCSCGRYFLEVGGIILAMEGDPCRDGRLPEALYDPVPPEELAAATIGDKRAADLPAAVVRFFRGCAWNEAMLRHAAAVINEESEKT